LWHGASVNFILWGLYFFVLLALEKWILLDFLNKHVLFARFYFILGILIGWAIFAITDLTQLTAYLSLLFQFKPGLDVVYYLSNYGVILIACVLFSTPLMTRLKTMAPLSMPLKLATGFLFLISLAYLVDSSYNPFLYFRF